MTPRNIELDYGKPIPYSPSLVKDIGSINATILFCHLLQLTAEEAIDGWVRKTSAELEDETALTYSAQKSAREQLIASGLVEEINYRSQHVIAFRVKVQIPPHMSAPEPKAPLKPPQVFYSEPREEIYDDIMEFATRRKPKARVNTKTSSIARPVNSGSSVNSGLAINSDLALNSGSVAVNSVGIQKSKPQNSISAIMLAKQEADAEKAKQAKDVIKAKIENKLKVVCDDSQWRDFINFAYVREEKHKEPVETYLKWALNEGYDPIYWTPSKMKTTYPRAFMHKQSPVKSKQIHVAEEYKEKECAPMPEELKVKQVLY